MSTVQLFAGGLTRIDQHGQWTGIYKRLLAGPQRLSVTGLAGDVQADRRVHGGPEKALHHYAVENYQRLAGRFPGIAALLVPGSIGENISGSGLDEGAVCIGDVFRLGKATLQVSQPRSPCWKIDHRYGCADLARTISESGLTGWYYRVLEAGMVSSGETLVLLDRLPGAVSLSELWQVWRAHRPDPVRLEQLAATPGLTADWQQKLAERSRWLRANVSRPTPRTSADDTGG